MIKRLAAVTVIIGAAALAQGAATTQPAMVTQQDATKRVNMHVLSMRLAALHKRLVGELKLDKKLEARVQKILADYRQEIVTWVAKNGPEINKLSQQLTAFHKGKSTQKMEAIKAASDRLRKLRADQKRLAQSVLTPLRKILTDGQLDKTRAILSLSRPQKPQSQNPPVPFYLLERLGLTDGQLRSIGKIRDAAGLVKPTADRDPLKEAWEKILRDVLTDKDRRKLEDVKKASQRKVMRSMLGGVDLTEEQYVKINQMWAAAEKKAADSESPEAGIDVFRQAYQDIVRTVLTPDQRKRMKKGTNRHQDKGPSKAG